MEKSSILVSREIGGERISIIVPVYNTEAYLAQCVDSLLEQTYRNIEIILVDDGSTDRSGMIADDYCEKFKGRIKCIHLENGGVLRARLLGVKHAQGNWIGFVDSDDTVKPEMYERLMENAKDENADISHCGYQTISPDGTIFYFYNTKKKYVRNTIKALEDLLTGNLVEPGLCNKMFRKELFDDDVLNIFQRIRVSYNEDLLLNYLLFKNARLSVFEDCCYYLYYSRSTTATRSGFNIRKVKDPIKVGAFILSDCDEELKEEAHLHYLKTCIHGVEGIESDNRWEKEKAQLLKRIIKEKRYWKKLHLGCQLKTILMVFFPRLFTPIFSIYCKWIRRKRYI